MASQVVLSFAVLVLVVQTVYGQCINNVVAQPAVGNYGYGNGLNLASNGLGYGSGLNCASNGLGYGELGYGGLGYGGFGYGGLNNGVDLAGASGSAGVLSVSSGSGTTPNGLSILSENLELGGQLEVSGAYPFVTAVGINGALPSGGGATVSYSSAPGVGLSSASCGAGLSGNAGIVNNGAYGISGNYGGGASIVGAGLINSGSYGISGYNNIGRNYAGISGGYGCGN